MVKIMDGNHFNFFSGTAINFLERETDFKHLEDIEKYYRC